MKFLKPNFEHEWEDALRYREIENMDKDEWLKICKKGEIVNYNDIKNFLGNVNLDFDILDFDKKKRFEKHFKTGKIELPIAVKFGDKNYNLLSGNTRLAGLLKNKINPKLWIIDMNKKPLKKQETKESTDAGSSGSFEASLSSPIKRKITTINNSTTTKEKELAEVTDSSSSGQYDVPFGGYRKDPLKIDGEKSIKQSRAVKDPNFPKWGGPGGVFIKIKDKCKKFPYCNQGDINAIEILREAIDDTHRKYGIPKEKITELIIKEINEIFIVNENKRTK